MRETDRQTDVVTFPEDAQTDRQTALAAGCYLACVSLAGFRKTRKHSPAREGVFFFLESFCVLGARERERGKGSPELVGIYRACSFRVVSK